MKKELHINIYRILTWGIIGIITTFSICAMILTDGFSLKQPLYNCGDIYEISNSIYKSDITQEKGYQEKTGKVILDKGEYVYSLSIAGKRNKWNYFCLTLDECNVDLKCEVFYENWKKNTIKREKKIYNLDEGLNIFKVPKNSFNSIVVRIKGEAGTSFIVKKIELRELKPLSNFKKVFNMSPLFFLGYTLISGILIYCWNKNRIKCYLYSWIEVLQGIYLLITEQFKRIISPLSKPTRSWMRRFGFLFIFLYNVGVEISQTYYDKFKYHLVVYIFLLLIIAIASIESNISKKNWNNPLVRGWIILGIMMCISDFLIPKDFRFWGYALIIAIGFYNFIWNNMKDPTELLQDFVWAVHIFLGLILCFCLLFRPETENIRYSGISKNPSIFALYLSTIWAVILGTLENKIRLHRHWLSILITILEGCAVLTLLWKSQSAGPILCVGLLAFIWLFKIHLYLKKEKKQIILAKIILIVMLCIIPVYSSITYGLNHIPQTLDTEVVFEGESPIAKKSYGTVAYAADIGEKLKNTRLGEKFSNTNISGIVSGRNYYWKAYLRNMNLVGHEERPVMWGHRRKPHNSIIGMAYNYGVFTAIPYVIMLIAVIERTFRYSKKNIPLASVPFYVCFTSILMSLSDNVEQPFVWLPWIGLYFLMGIVFDDSQLEERRMGK